MFKYNWKYLRSLCVSSEVSCCVNTGLFSVVSSGMQVVPKLSCALGLLTKHLKYMLMDPTPDWLTPDSGRLKSGNQKSVSYN